MNFIGFLKTQQTEELVQLWNEFCAGDDYIYQGVEDMADLYSDPAAFARAVYFGDVQNWLDDYARLNGYGNIVTFNFWDSPNSPIDLDTLAEWLEEDDHEVYLGWVAEFGNGGEVEE